MFIVCVPTQGTPQVTETFLDSKKEVDNQLKRTCEDFIHYISDYFVGPLQDFLNKVGVWEQVSKFWTPSVAGMGWWCTCEDLIH